MTAYSAGRGARSNRSARARFHYLTKPFKLDELALFLDRALEDSRLRREAASLRSALRARFGLANVVGRSEPMRAGERARGTHRRRIFAGAADGRDGYGQVGSSRVPFTRKVRARVSRSSRSTVPPSPRTFWRASSLDT